MIDTAEDPRYQLTKKPFGYSWFAKDLAPVPQAWVATSGDLRIFRAHMDVSSFTLLLVEAGWSANKAFARREDTLPRSKSRPCCWPTSRSFLLRNGRNR